MTDIAAAVPALGSQSPTLSSPPIRVAFDMRSADRNQTGTGVYARQMLNHLRNCQDVDVQTLAGWRPFASRRSRPGRMARTAMDASWTHLQLPMVLARLNIDLLHSPAFVAPLWGTCPLVVTVHDTMYLRFPEQYAQWWLKSMAWQMPKVLARAKAVIVGSEAAKIDIVQDYGIDSTRVRVIYYGVDHERFRPTTDPGIVSRLARYGVKGEYVLHVGGLVARKNIPLLLEAVALLKRWGEWGARQVVVVGTSSPGMPGVQEIDANVRRLGLVEEVVFTGHVPDADLPTLYTGAAALAFPSRYEGFGFPLIEAMACGVPVIAAAGSSISEIVGTAGLLVPGGQPEAFAAGLQTVLEDASVRTVLRQRGLERAAEFTWERAAQQTVDVYRDVLLMRG